MQDLTQTTLHLRAECKPLEHRAALTPTTTKALVDAGYQVNVEHSTERIFEDSEYEQAGAKLVPEGSWRDAPKDHIILGLKELPDESFPLKHVHVQFAHCFKGQHGWQEVLGRFPRGGGTLLDLEFLTDASGRRVAAFGYHAGFAGAALALRSWAWQLTHVGSSSGELLPGVESYANEAALIAHVKQDLAAAQAKVGRLPRVIVIGALGRCGRGAVDMCHQAGVPDDAVLRWDLEETKPGGPFAEIAECDIFVNCIYLTTKIPHFVDRDSLNSAESRNLSVVCDVSADGTNPNNPVPLYTVATTFDKPTVPVHGLKDNGPPVTVISIDHLPSLLPREASEAFSADLLPYLLELNKWKDNPVWARAKAVFDEQVVKLPDSMKKAEL